MMSTELKLGRALEKLRRPASTANAGPDMREALNELLESQLDMLGVIAECVDAGAASHRIVMVENELAAAQERVRGVARREPGERGKRAPRAIADLAREGRPDGVSGTGGAAGGIAAPGGRQAGGVLPPEARVRWGGREALWLNWTLRRRYEEWRFRERQTIFVLWVLMLLICSAPLPVHLYRGHDPGVVAYAAPAFVALLAAITQYIMFRR